MKKLIPILFVFSFYSMLLNAQWRQTNGPFDYNVRSLALCGSKIFAGTDVLGLYSSSNDGSNWTLVRNGIDVWALACNDSTIFAGTSFGLYISSDTGVTWTQINNVFASLPVISFAINGSNVFAGTGGGSN